jgi:hypothetical protein
VLNLVWDLERALNVKEYRYRISYLESWDLSQVGFLDFMAVVPGHIW